MKPDQQPLTREQVASIVKMLEQTCDQELNCGECLRHVSEYAERQLAGLPLDQVVASVEQHLAVCPECQEEYLALMKILKAGQ
jgi:hypothetical protein